MCFFGQPQELSLRFVFYYVADDAHIVPDQVGYSPAANRFVEDAEPYGFSVSRVYFRNAEDGVPYERIVLLSGVFRRQP